MNIFVLDTNPRRAARDHCDKHVCKMILEYAQLLSTAHRLLDGTETMVLEADKTGKQKLVKRWIIDDVVRSTLWQATHYNHPCAVWAREAAGNYQWLHSLLGGVLDEYRIRYGKEHGVSGIISRPFGSLYDRLRYLPHSIPTGDDKRFPESEAPLFGTPWPLCMPDQYKGPSVVESYRAFYLGEKMRFAKWKNGKTPAWVTDYTFVS